MSETFSIVCRETRLRIWIGQGRGEMSALYSGQPETMERLRRFLNAHLGRTLEFVCDDREDSIHGEGWQEFEAVPTED